LIPTWDDRLATLFPSIGRYVARRRGHLVAVYPMDDDRVNRARCPSKVPQLMALGIPLVAEAVGEIPHHLAGFDSECLVAPGDIARFKELAESLLTDPVRRAALGQRLRATSDRWRWEHTAAGLLDWYFEV
jgi:glycosyltransferase involved in cell wall biosynthesis